MTINLVDVSRCENP